MKVLDVLKQHANENIRELSKRCGFSPQKVGRVIKNLEKEKRIWGYTAVEDGEANELKHFILLVKRSKVPFDAFFKKEIVFERLDDYNTGSVKIEDIYLAHGSFDGVITFYAPDIISAKKLVQELFRRIGKYFDDYRLLETLVPIRKQGLKNPQIEKLVEYL